MKHFVILLVSTVLLYGLWHLTSPLTQKTASKRLARHAFRLLAVGLVLLILLVTAYYTPALHLL